jgi:hypothetical protein
VNDALRTTLCLRYPSALLASCCLFLAAAHLNVRGVTLARLGHSHAGGADARARSVCVLLRDMYAPLPAEVRPVACGSAPAMWRAFVCGVCIVCACAAARHVRAAASRGESR